MLFRLMSTTNLKCFVCCYSLVSAATLFIIHDYSNEVNHFFHAMNIVFLTTFSTIPVTFLVVNTF